MSVQVYILIQTEVGKASSVATAIGAIAGVTLSEGVTGPYDVIMRAESPSMEDFVQSAGCSRNYTNTYLSSHTPLISERTVISK
jgi:hypothetical protein